MQSKKIVLIEQNLLYSLPNELYMNCIPVFALSRICINETLLYVMMIQPKILHLYVSVESGNSEVVASFAVILGIIAAIVTLFIVLVTIILFITM